MVELKRIILVRVDKECHDQLKKDKKEFKKKDKKKRVTFNKVIKNYQEKKK